MIRSARLLPYIIPENRCDGAIMLERQVATNKFTSLLMRCQEYWGARLPPLKRDGADYGAPI